MTQIQKDRVSESVIHRDRDSMRRKTMIKWQQVRDYNIQMLGDWMDLKTSHQIPILYFLHQNMFYWRLFNIVLFFCVSVWKGSYTRYLMWIKSLSLFPKIPTGSALTGRSSESLETMTTSILHYVTWLFPDAHRTKYPVWGTNHLFVSFENYAFSTLTPNNQNL